MLHWEHPFDKLTRVLTTASFNALRGGAPRVVLSKLLRSRHLLKQSRASRFDCLAFWRVWTVFKKSSELVYACGIKQRATKLLSKGHIILPQLRHAPFPFSHSGAAGWIRKDLSGAPRQGISQFSHQVTLCKARTNTADTSGHQAFPLPQEDQGRCLLGRGSRQ